MTRPLASHNGRVAIVTGAGQGIGRAIATGLAARGATLVLVDLVPPETLARELGNGSIALTADVSRNADWQDIAKVIDERFERADILVNNAGIYPFASLEELDTETWRRTMAINLDAHFFSAKSMVPLMRRGQWGRIVSISSNAVGIVTRQLAHYTASKMGAIGLVRGLAAELGEYGITINAVLPGITDTAGTRDQTEIAKAAVWKQQSIARLGTPEDVVGSVLFLTSEDACYVTGQALAADGGLHFVG